MTHIPTTGAGGVKQPSIAVVIGSGGLKTFAAIALFELLDEAGIVPDLMIGCSGGAVMTAVRAIGYKPADMLDLIPRLLNRELFSKVDYRVLLGIPKLPFGKFDITRGIIKSAGLMTVYRQLFGGRQLEDLHPTTLLQVTDFHSGEGFVLENGPLDQAVYASGSLYPVLPPIQMAGRWLTDGGFSSPCPLFEAVKRNIDIILVCSIETRLAAEPKSCIDLFSYGQSLCANTLIRNQMTTAIALHHYEIVQINVRFTTPIELWDVDKVPYVLEMGRKAVEAKRDEILSTIQNFSPVSITRE